MTVAHVVSASEPTAVTGYDSGTSFGWASAVDRRRWSRTQKAPHAPMSISAWFRATRSKRSGS